MELLEGEGTPSIFVDREYVYVPSGASGYVDEFICQIDRYQDVWYILQDVNSNVIALTDDEGEVVRQHTFDPYGEILTAEDFDTHPGIKVGHQGLFFDRLEPPAPSGGLISMSAAVQLQPGVFGLYQARNRVLLPRYGRWAQKDPNASGMLHASLWHDGQEPMPELAAGSLQGVVADGLNLFAFVGSRPFNATDPVGLAEFNLSGTALNMGIAGSVFGAVGGAIVGWDQTGTWQGAAGGAMIGGAAGYFGGAAFGLMMPAGGFAAGAAAGMTGGTISSVLGLAIRGEDFDAELAYKEGLINAAFWAVVGGIADSFFEGTFGPSTGGSSGVVFANRGSSKGARTAPHNLREQLAMQEVMSDPKGIHLKSIPMTDKRWLREHGWQKWAQNVDGIEIHYVRCRIDGRLLVDDFKFKN